MADSQRDSMLSLRVFHTWTLPESVGSSLPKNKQHRGASTSLNKHIHFNSTFHLFPLRLRLHLLLETALKIIYPSHTHVQIHVHSDAV
jgi:hypothetical protein